MAIHHAVPGELIAVRPLGSGLRQETTKTLYKSERLELFRMILLAGETKPVHQVPGELTVQCIEGLIELSFAGINEAMQRGDLKCLVGGEPFALKAFEDSSLLFTLLLHEH
ncbi:cupin [Variovorax sp. PBL-E5]|uniref:cupin n=1 Tax=Variovorax sp. PBL-E5 TaxID=434014 RepID=UPI0013196AAA|nr:cupin [Variovorax sp. PBL-E5]VTU21865.1 hypothetical protein E5CHR_01274 [Variovorax sp. PBL-E5]